MEEQSFSVDEAITHVGFGKYQWLILLYTGLGFIAEVMEIMILSFIGPAIKSEWGISSAQETVLTSALFAGFFLGSYFWGFVSDNCGRRKGFLGMAVLTSVIGFLSAFSPNYTTLVILRALVGIGLGSAPVFLSWFLEFVPAQSRGMWSAVISCFWAFGSILESTLALIVMQKLNWRWLLAFSSIPSFIVLLLYHFAPESPMYLYTKGRSRDAYLVLESLALTNGRELPSGMLVSPETDGMNEDFVNDDEVPLLVPCEKKTTEVKSGLSTISVLFSSTLIRTTLLLWILFFGNSFFYYGIILLTSGLSSGQSRCGSSELNLEDSVDESLYYNVFITSFAELPGLLFSALIIDRVGRKASMMVLSVLTFLFLLPLVVYESANVITASLVGARMFANGMFSIAIIYAPEVYPTSARSTGSGIASGMARLGGVVCPLVAVGLINNCHQTAAVILMEVVVCVSMVCTIFLPFETKGRKLIDSSMDLVSH